MSTPKPDRDCRQELAWARHKVGCYGCGTGFVCFTQLASYRRQASRRSKRRFTTGVNRERL